MKLLITGCHRSGTTLLASMIGMHNDVALINEDYFNSFENILCKKYIGTKAVIPSILLDTKHDFLFTAIYRKILYLRRILKLPHAIGFLPYCINDFDKVIIIYRSIQENINSIMNRTGVSEKYAWRDIDIANKIQDKLIHRHNVCFVFYSNLTKNPKHEMKTICNFLGIGYDPKMLEGYKHTPVYKNNQIIQQP